MFESWSRFSKEFINEFNPNVYLFNFIELSNRIFALFKANEILWVSGLLGNSVMSGELSTDIKSEYHSLCFWDWAREINQSIFDIYDPPKDITWASNRLPSWGISISLHSFWWVHPQDHVASGGGFFVFCCWAHALRNAFKRREINCLKSSVGSNVRHFSKSLMAAWVFPSSW